MDNEYLYINNIPKYRQYALKILRLRHRLFHRCFVLVSALFPRCFIEVTHQKGNNVETSIVSSYVSTPKMSQNDVISTVYSYLYKCQNPYDPNKIRQVLIQKILEQGRQYTVVLNIRVFGEGVSEFSGKGWVAIIYLFCLVYVKGKGHSFCFMLKHIIRPLIIRN